jgi:hypothetical protein
VTIAVTTVTPNTVGKSCSSNSKIKFDSFVKAIAHRWSLYKGSPGS